MLESYTPRFLDDRDRELLRADGLTEEQIETEERALRESFVPNPEYRNSMTQKGRRMALRDLRRSLRHRKPKEGVSMTAVAPSVIARRTVPLSSLWLEAVHWTNPRQLSGLGESEIDELAQSIKDKGLIDAPKVQKIIVNGEVHDLVIDGQRRVLGARNVLPKNFPIPVVDIEDEPCELTPEKADELLLKALTTLERADLSSYELLEVAVRMSSRNKPGTYIAKAIHKSTSWVSRMLQARSTASPKLSLQWRKGEITDEQFKELAAVKGEEAQAAAVKEVVETRKSGDKAEARVRSKEIAATARAEKEKNTPAKGSKAKPVVAGPQLDLIEKDKPAPTAAAPAPKAPKPPSKLAVEELLGMSDKRPPIHDLVKGIMLGVRYMAGLVEPHEFGKPWAQYVNRVSGNPRPAKKAKPAKKAVKARKPKAVKAGKKRGKR